jgi:hypothetical protein
MELVFVRFIEFAPLIKRAETKPFNKINQKIKICLVINKLNKNQKQIKSNDKQESRTQVINNKKKIYIK